MKIKYIPIILFFLILITLSCEKDEFLTPKADFEIYRQDPVNYVVSKLSEPYQVKVGEQLTFKFIGQGQYIVIWFGEKKYDYSKIGISDVKGTAFNENETSRNYTYTSAGNFTIVCIASSYRYKPEKFEQIKIEKSIFVEPANQNSSK